MEGAKYVCSPPPRDTRRRHESARSRKESSTSALHLRTCSARTGQARLGYRPSKKSIKCMVEQIRALTDRTGTWQETTKLLGKVNRTLRGWANHVLPSRHRQQGVSGTRRLHSDAAAPVVVVQAQNQAAQGRDISTLASLRALRARTPEPAWARRVVGEGVKFCPRAGCGRSACPVR